MNRYGQFRLLVEFIIEINDLYRRIDGAFGIVFMGNRRAEDSGDPILVTENLASIFLH